MTDTEREFNALQKICPTAKLLKEGALPLVLLPDMQVSSSGQTRQMDLLLHPSQHGGYTTRLFFQNRIEGRGANWNQFRVAGQNWWAPSWNHVPANLPWTQILVAHLRAVA